MASWADGEVEPIPIDPMPWVLNERIGKFEVVVVANEKALTRLLRIVVVAED